MMLIFLTSHGHSLHRFNGLTTRSYNEALPCVSLEKIQHPRSELNDHITQIAYGPARQGLHSLA